MPTELDELMMELDADPTLPKPGSIEKLIAYYRKERARKALGGRAKKAEGPAKDMTELAASLGITVTPSVPADFKRRV